MTQPLNRVHAGVHVDKLELFIELGDTNQVSVHLNAHQALGLGRALWDGAGRQAPWFGRPDAAFLECLHGVALRATQVLLTAYRGGVVAAMTVDPTASRIIEGAVMDLQTLRLALDLVAGENGCERGAPAPRPTPPPVTDAIGTRTD